MSEPTPPSPWSWNARNLAALAILLVLLAGLIGWRIVRNSARLAEDFSIQGSAPASAGEKVDPNTASWANLARLPEIGPTRAKKIIAYRDAYTARHPGQPAFTSPSDLEKVQGIGPSISKTIAPFLTFAPATQP